MSMTTPIVDFVRSYAQSGTARLHMPGHKGQSLLGFEPLDITEICGADELYAPEGIIAESEANATRLFGTAHSYYSTEGSSQCIRAMLFLALQGAPQNGRRPVLLAARNAHKALLYAAVLLDFDIRWLWPSAQAEGALCRRPEPADIKIRWLWPSAQAEGALCSCPVTAEALTGALHALAQQGISPFGVYVTSPDYLGGVQDIPALAAVCRAQGVPLLVDNAHGAYLRFLPQNSHPIAQGAAMCCDSAHKTLPVVTGGAYLHLAHDAPVQDEAAVRGALALFGSTSPSYLILQSLDVCNAVLAGDYPRRLVQCCAALEGLRRSLNKAAAARQCPVPLAVAGAQQEPMKLTLDAAALGCTGTALADALRRAQMECEYADPRYVVLMFTPENPPQDYTRLQATLEQLLAAVPAVLPRPENRAGEFAALQQQAVQRCTIRQAVLGAQVRIPVHKALGRVCAMPTVSCPPAIPVAVSGEEITPAAIALMQRYGIEELSVLR